MGPWPHKPTCVVCSGLATFVGLAMGLGCWRCSNEVNAAAAIIAGMALLVALLTLDLRGPNDPPPAKRCGGARIGYDTAGCGAVLRYESTAHGLEFWRCPQCGNPHWFKVESDRCRR